MISYDVDGGAGPFEVVSPPFEGVVDSRKLFVVDVVIGLGIFKRLGVECDQMVVTIRDVDGYWRSRYSPLLGKRPNGT